MGNQIGPVRIEPYYVSSIGCVVCVGYKNRNNLCRVRQIGVQELGLLQHWWIGVCAEWHKELLSPF